LLALTTALPWLVSTLLTDIFAGLSVLSPFVLVAHGEKVSALEKLSLFGFTAFAAATHSATLGVLLGLCGLGWIARPFLRRRIALSGLVHGSLTIVAGAAMLLAANFALSGQLAWTPGGYGVAFGRMMQDGIVARYLNDHCGEFELKLCPYRNQLPATADEFLWGKSMFNTLGRFQGLNDEMGFIVTHSLADYPLWQAEAAISATAQQLVHVATGEGTNGWIPPHLWHHRALHARAAQADARGASAALGYQFRRHQPAPRSRCTGVDADCGRDVRIRHAAATARRSHAAGGDRVTGLAWQRVHLRRHIRTASPLRRAHGVDCNVYGADRAGKISCGRGRV
jgi:hypothetical protein